MVINCKGDLFNQGHFHRKVSIIYKSSWSGATEHIKIFLVSNINTTSIRYLKKKNFWVCAFDLSSKKDFV